MGRILNMRSPYSSETQTLWDFEVPSQKFNSENYFVVVGSWMKFCYQSGNENHVFWSFNLEMNAVIMIPSRETNILKEKFRLSYLF